MQTPAPKKTFMHRAAINDQATSTPTPVLQYVFDPAIGKAVQKNVTIVVRKPVTHPEVMIGKCIYNHFIPATLGNSSGAIIFIGIIYWCVYACV